MVLMDLIERLEKEDPSLVVPNGFNSPHSYRGYYDQLAFEPAENVTVGEMLACCREADGAVYTGYKGGEYRMCGYTDVNIANCGKCGDELSARLLEYMLKEARQDNMERLKKADAQICQDIVEDLMCWIDRCGATMPYSNESIKIQLYNIIAGKLLQE